MMRSAPFTPEDFTDVPFRPAVSRETSPIVTVIALPFPPSTNRIWARGGHGNVTLSKDYRAWKEAADKFVLFTGDWRRAKKIPGPFRAEIILDRSERKRAGDLDNRIKAVLDWCQSRELIRNDRDLERLGAAWGEAPHGCLVTLTEVAA
jgi:Holliday junction resolvase RusA-like endonuclease